MDPLVQLRMIRTNDPKAATLKVVQGIPARALADSLRENNSITQIILSGLCEYPIDDFCVVLEAISEISTLKTVDLSSMDLDDEFLEHVVDLVANSTSIVRLDISENFISPYVAEEMGKAMRNHPTLRFVDMSSCEMGNAGVAGFLEELTGQDCKLEKLDLGHNNLMGSGIGETIAEFTSRNESLLSLHLRGNFVPGEFLKIVEDACITNRAEKKTVELAGKTMLGFLSHVVEPRSPVGTFKHLRAMHVALAKDLGHTQ